MHTLEFDLLDIHLRSGSSNLGLLKFLRNKAVEDGNNTLCVVIDNFIEKENTILQKSIELLCLRNDLRKGSPLTTEDLIFNIIDMADLRKNNSAIEINNIEALPDDAHFTEEQKNKSKSIYSLLCSILDEYKANFNT